MTEPYTPAQIAAYLRDMPTERLATAQPSLFQTWPTRNIVDGKVIRELIDNEKARRG